MKKAFFASLTFCFIVFVAATIRAENLPPDEGVKCPVCGMLTYMFADWNARIEFKDGSTAVFDGAKCMFKYILDMKKYAKSKRKKDIARILVKDFYTKSPIDARNAHYVIWSDIYGPMGHEPIPFVTKAAAQKFLREHKGRKIISFTDVDSRLILSFDNP